MIRVFFLYILPILLPSVMYFCWILFIHKPAEPASDKRTLMGEGPWFRLILAGLGLMIIGLVITAISGGMSPEGEYQAPYMKDGEIVPGQMTPKQE